MVFPDSQEYQNTGVMRTIFLMAFFLAFQLNSFSQEKIDLLILNKKYEEALQQIDKRIEKQPDGTLYYKKGLVLNSMQKFQEAVSAFSLALEFEPKNSDILVELADALSTLGNYHDANPFYEKAARLQSQNLTISAKLGRNYIQLDKYQKAYTVFEHVFHNDSTNTYWNKQLAFCAHQIGKKEQAISLYEKGIQMNPRDYTSWFNLIRLYQQKEQFGKALEIIEKGIENFPGDAGFYQQQANQLFGNKQYDVASGAYENYFEAGGDSLFKVLLNYGISLYFSGNQNKAIEMLNICASQVANDPFVLFYLSLSYKKLAQYEVSEAFMNAAIESATPAYLPEMYHHLGQIFGQQRKFEESVIALKKANELDPTNHEVLFEIATTYEEFNSNKTLALNYYTIYLKEAGESARNVNYALDRINKIKEDLFFEK
jgi:tetratricopeptide (TPR) repeat protein